MEEDSCVPVDGYVKHIFEHIQEADHLANLGAGGHRKITVKEGYNTKHRKAVRGFLGRQQKGGVEVYVEL